MKTKFPKANTIVLHIDDFKNGLDVYTNQNVLSHKYCVDCFNFDYKSGALTPGIGFSELTFPTGDQADATEVVAQEVVANHDISYYKIAHYIDFSTFDNRRSDKLVFLTKQNEVLFGRIVSQYPTITHLEDLTFESKPKYLNTTIDGTKCIFFFGVDQKIRMWNGGSTIMYYNNTPYTTDMCAYNDYFIGIVGKEQELLRIDRTVPYFWTGNTAYLGQNISIDGVMGSANRLLNFKDFVFVLRDYGISKLNYDAFSDSFSINNWQYIGSSIYGDTACVCGDKCLVLCKDGLYQFDSVSVKKLDLKINKLIENQTNKNAVAVYKNGVYYLACKLDFGDNLKIGCENGTYTNNALVVLDMATMQCSVCRGVDINDLCAIRFMSADKVLASFNSGYQNKIAQIDASGKNFSDNPTRYWQSPLSDLGYPEMKKLVKDVSIFSKYDITLTVFTEKEKKGHQRQR